MGDFYEALHTEPNVRAHFLKFGGGVGAVTKVKGKGMTVTYNAAGIVDIAWSENPGVFLGLAGEPAFQSTTIAGTKDFSGKIGVYANKALQLRLYESGALADLAVLEWCSLTLLFSADGSL
jgi:hypothetical protein